MPELNNIPHWLQIIVVLLGSGGLTGWLVNMYNTKKNSELQKEKQDSSIKIDEYNFLVKSWQERVDDIKKDWNKVSDDMTKLEQSYLQVREENATLKADFRSIKEENSNLKSENKNLRLEILDLRGKNDKG